MGETRAPLGAARRRLLITTDHLLQNGAERQMALTVTNLPARWEVRCFSVGDGPFAAFLRDRGVHVTVVERRWRFDPLPFLRLWLTVARWRPEIVHSWGYMTTLTGFPIFKLLGVPFVDSTIRTGDVQLSGYLPHRAGIDRATLVVANCRAGLESACISDQRGRVIRNGFDPSRIPDVAPARRDQRFTVVMAARMTQPKDHETVIAAARLLVDSLGSSTVRFVFLGDGRERPLLESRHRDLVDAGVLEFRHAGDVVPQLLVSDCGVLMTSRHLAVEGCSNAILEYMSCGLPTVCSRGGGTDELVVPGETGFLVAPGDAADLAARLGWIHAHRDAAKEMGNRGAEVVRRDYSVEQMIRATEAVYAEALRG